MRSGCPRLISSLVSVRRLAGTPAPLLLGEGTGVGSVSLGSFFRFHFCFSFNLVNLRSLLASSPITVTARSSILCVHNARTAGPHSGIKVPWENSCCSGMPLAHAWYPALPEVLSPRVPQRPCGYAWSPPSFTSAANNCRTEPSSRPGTSSRGNLTFSDASRILGAVGFLVHSAKDNLNR